MSASAVADLERETPATSRVEQARALAKDFLPWGGLAAFLAAAIFGGLGADLKLLLIQWGPGLLIFLVLVAHLSTFVRATERTASALTSIARSQEGMAKHEDIQEVLIGQEALRRETVETREELRGVHADVLALSRSLTDGRRG